MENIKGYSVEPRKAEPEKPKPLSLAKIKMLAGDTLRVVRKGSAPTAIVEMTPGERLAKQKKKAKRRAQGKARRK